MTLVRRTDEHFESLSWHDNAIHSFRVIKGGSATGQLVLDIDHILEWRPNGSGAFSFLVAPATLTFNDVSALKVALDSATPTAALTTFTIDQIDRSVEKRQHFDAVLWRIPINWPIGDISFEASGFAQELRASQVVSQSMSLPRPASGAGA